MAKEASKDWQRISTKLNFSPSHSHRTGEYIENNLDRIKSFKAEDIDDIDVQPSSVILRIAKHSPSKLNEVLDSWKDNNQLNEIFYRIAGEANPQSIANTLSGVSKVKNKEFLNGFYDALENCGRTEDFVQNANKEELYHAKKALSQLDRDDAKNTIESISQKQTAINIQEASQAKASTTIQSIVRGQEDRRYTELVKKSYDDLNGQGHLEIPQGGIERRAFNNALEISNRDRNNLQSALDVNNQTSRFR